MSVVDLLGWTVSRKHRAKMQKPTDSATVTAVSRRGRKIGGGAAKKARTRKVKNTSQILASGEQAREKSGDEEASLNDSVEKEEEEEASTAALKDVTNTASLSTFPTVPTITHSSQSQPSHTSPPSPL